MHQGRDLGNFVLWYLLNISDWRDPTWSTCTRDFHIHDVNTNLKTSCTIVTFYVLLDRAVIPGLYVLCSASLDWLGSTCIPIAPDFMWKMSYCKCYSCPKCGGAMYFLNPAPLSVILWYRATARLRCVPKRSPSQCVANMIRQPPHQFTGQTVTMKVFKKIVAASQPANMAVGGTDVEPCWRVYGAQNNSMLHVVCLIEICPQVSPAQGVELCRVRFGLLQSRWNRCKDISLIFLSRIMNSCWI